MSGSSLASSRVFMGNNEGSRKMKLKEKAAIVEV
jgi:hypothetical protein